MTEQRIPKVGEVWASGDVSAKIKLVEDNHVYYYVTSPFGDEAYGRKLESFLKYYNPPKPKPREAWVLYNPKDKVDPWREAYSSKEAARQSALSSYEVIHIREVLEE